MSITVSEEKEFSPFDGPAKSIPKIKNEPDYSSLAVKAMVDLVLLEQEVRIVQDKKNIAVRQGKFERAVQYRQKELNLYAEVKVTLKLLGKISKKLK